MSTLDISPEWKSKIEEVKSDNELNGKNSNELIALISFQIENHCYKERSDIQDALTIMTQSAYLYSRAFESKIGNVQEVFSLLITNYNNVRS